MVILGLDPGTATTGYGVIRVLGNRFQMLEYGIISTPPKMAMEKRLEMIYDNLQELLLKWQPDQAAVEAGGPDQAALEARPDQALRRSSQSSGLHQGCSP